jgi:hypothetical protein
MKSIWDNGYRLPEQCCANCKGAYTSSYGDNQCNCAPGSVIDAGGLCDLYVFDDTVILQPKVETTPLPVDEKPVGCSGCMYLYEDVCIDSGKPAKKRCKKYEPRINDSSSSDILDTTEHSDIQPPEQTGKVDCVHCQHSYLGVDGNPYCAALCTVLIDVNGTCNKATAVVTCALCYYSYEDNSGRPVCAFNEHIIVDTEATCEHAKLEAV